MLVNKSLHIFIFCWSSSQLLVESATNFSILSWIASQLLRDWYTLHLHIYFNSDVLSFFTIAWVRTWNISRNSCHNVRFCSSATGKRRLSMLSHLAKIPSKHSNGRKKSLSREIKNTTRLKDIHREKVLQRLQKVQIWAFGLLIQQINSL